MTDFTTLEKEAIKAGAKMFGEYIKSINKQEAFRGITGDEFMTALECYTKEYHEKLIKTV